MTKYTIKLMQYVISFYETICIFPEYKLSVVGEQNIMAPDIPDLNQLDFFVLRASWLCCLQNINITNDTDEPKRPTVGASRSILVRMHFSKYYREVWKQCLILCGGKLSTLWLINRIVCFIFEFFLRQLKVILVKIANKWKSLLLFT